MVLSSALRNENLLSASGNTSVLMRPGLLQLLSDMYFFMRATLLYLCFTSPASFPSSSPLPRYPFFPPLNIHPFPASWLKSLIADRGTYCLLVREQSPPNTGKLTWEGAICGAPPGTVGHVVWCCSAVAFLCSWPFADGGASVSSSSESPAVLSLFHQFLISGATNFHVKVENELKYEDWWWSRD